MLQLLYFFVGRQKCHVANQGKILYSMLGILEFWLFLPAASFLRAATTVKKEYLDIKTLQHTFQVRIQIFIIKIPTLTTMNENITV